ncbi:MAG: deaminase [Clostridiales bacterium]
MISEFDIKMMKEALKLSKKCPYTKKAYSVGVVITDLKNSIIATGYSRETSDNVHAEEVAINKLSQVDINYTELILYSTMEPCGLRLSGKLCCADRIIKSGIKNVVYGISEPSYFIEKAIGIEKLKANGINVKKIETKVLINEIIKMNIIK